MFSVVIPAYNSEKFIMGAVNSVLNQTYKDFELIIVDDGSKDKTRNVIEALTDSRIRYIYQDNGGVSSARNKGITSSLGSYVCFLDSDDEWKPEHLAELDALISEYPDCGMYMTGYDIRLNNGEVIHKSREILKRISEEQITSDNGYDVLIRNGYFFNTNTICCRRDVFDKVGLFKVGVKNGEDDDMWLRIFAYYSIAISKRATTVYDRSNCGATAQRLVFEPAFLSRVDTILSDPEVLECRKTSLRMWVERNKLSQARKHILAGNKREARKLLFKTKIGKVNKKKYLETLLCLLIPTKIVKGRIDKRDANYYN